MLPRLTSQHILDELLAARHLTEALLIGGNAPYFLVRQRRAFMPSRFLLHVEAVGLSLETQHMPRGILENAAVARTEKLGWANAHRTLEDREKRLVARGIDDQPEARNQDQREGQRRCRPDRNISVRTSLLGANESQRLNEPREQKQKRKRCDHCRSGRQGEDIRARKPDGARKDADAPGYRQ